MRREQYAVFAISYLTNMMSLLGLSLPFITSSFFDDDDDPRTHDPRQLKVTLPEVQVILLFTAIMYIMLGSTLEYVKGIEFKVIIPIIVAFGLLKIIVRTSCYNCCDRLASLT
jgi:hypothetical protein